MDDLIRAFEQIVAQIERLLEQRAVASEESSSVEEEIEQLYSQMDLTKEKLANQTREQQLELAHGQTMNGHHMNGQNGIGQIEYGTLSSKQSGQEGNGGEPGEIPISPVGTVLDNDSLGGEEDKYNPSNRRRRRMSLGEQARLDTVTRLRSWLQARQKKTMGDMVNLMGILFDLL